MPCFERSQSEFNKKKFPWDWVSGDLARWGFPLSESGRGGSGIVFFFDMMFDDVDVGKVHSLT